jgi:hypothetical protein
MVVGTTRIIGKAGISIDMTHFLQGDLLETSAPVKASPAKWTYGTGAGQVNIIYADTTTLADGANTTLDLFSSGTLLDIFQRALTLSALKFLHIKNNSADATLKILGTAVTGLDIVTDPSDIIEIAPGGEFYWSAPTAAGIDLTTNKDLKLEHDGTGSSTMDVDVIAGGLD